MWKERLASLKVLRVAEHRGLYLDADRVASGSADRYLASRPDWTAFPPEAWERTINLLYIDDQFWGAEALVLQDYADQVERAWKQQLSVLNEDFVVHRWSDFTGIGLTFFFSLIQPDA